jgi:hypothetical protein
VQENGFWWEATFDRSHKNWTDYIPIVISSSPMQSSASASDESDSNAVQKHSKVRVAHENHLSRGQSSNKMQTPPTTPTEAGRWIDVKPLSENARPPRREHRERMQM